MIVGKHTKLREGAPIICGICNEAHTTLSISKHLKHSHDVNSKQYYDLMNPKAHEAKCLECGDATKFYNIVVGYTKFCSSACSNKSKIRTSKIVNSKKSKYGEDMKPIYDKQKLTNVSKSDEEKLQYLKNLSEGLRTFHEKNPGIFVGKNIPSEITKNTIANSHKNRSVEEVEKSTALRESTCLAKYGVSHVMHVEDFKIKSLDWLNDKEKVAMAMQKGEATKIKNGSKTVYSRDELNSYKVYKNKVHALTYKIAPKIFGDDVFDKLGLCGVDGALQIDHIVSTSYGWKNGIAPEIISCEHNLRLLPWRENLQKYSDNHMTIEALLSLYESNR